MATGYTTTGAAVFTNADPTKTLQEIILDGIGTKDHFSYQSGVKYKTILPYVSVTGLTDISTGDQSGYNLGSGGSNEKDITFETLQLSIKESYKPYTIQKYVLGLQIPGSNAEAGLPASDIILELKGKDINRLNEKYIWQADTSIINHTQTLTEGTTITKFDGILAQVNGVAGGYGKVTTSFSNLTDASILGHIQAMVDVMQTNAPQLIDIPTVLAMSPSQFAKYSRALYNLNGTVTTQTVGVDGKGLSEVYVPGTQIKAVSLKGLNGLNTLFLSHPDNVKAVYDLENEDEIVDFFYSKDADLWILRGNYKLGAKVVDPSLCFISA